MSPASERQVHEAMIAFLVSFAGLVGLGIAALALASELLGRLL